MDADVKWLVIGLVIGVILATMMVGQFGENKTNQFLDEVCKSQGYEKFSGFITGTTKNVEGKIISYSLSIGCVKISPSGVRTEKTIGTINIPVQ